MTTAYAQRSPEERSQFASGNQLRLVASAPAQGQEACKMRENVRAISLGARGYSAESEKLSAALRNLAESIETLQATMQSGDDDSYTHVPLKPAFTIQATYKRIGKLKPRQFPLDE